MLPLVPIAVGAVTGCIAAVVRRRRRPLLTMTAERQRIYDAALTTLRDPEKMRSLAIAFRQGGLRAEADMLEKRAALKELSPEVRQQRREIIKKALSHRDPKVVREVAAAFDKVGSTGAAATLRRYAAGLSHTRPAVRKMAPAEPIQEPPTHIDASIDADFPHVDEVPEEITPTDPNSGISPPEPVSDPNAPMEPVKPPITDRPPASR